MSIPLVSIICTSYNHVRFIEEALDSAFNQSYSPIQLIVIDNGSEDNSVGSIRNWIRRRGLGDIRTIFHDKTINYCKAFNQALDLSTGKYVIDLSGDDVLLKDHVKTAVDALETNGSAVYFSNAYWEKNGRSLSTFYPTNRKGQLLEKIPSGDVYEVVIRRTLICTPTMVFRAELLKREGGYDENLVYEDFDIIIRMARKYHFLFNSYIGVRKRILKTSYSAKQYRVKTSMMLPSTFKVCEKIAEINRTEKENQALRFRVMFETKHALSSANFDVADRFLRLAKKIGVRGLRFQLYLWWAKKRLNLSSFYRLYQSLGS